MSKDKVYPSHRISFSEQFIDQDGREALGAPTDVAAAWPRKGDKQGSIFKLRIDKDDVDKVNSGVFFLLENELQQSRGSNNASPFKKTSDKGNSRDKGRER